MENSLLSMRLCRDYPGRLAIVSNGQNCTYEEMHWGILGLEKRLRAMGVKQGSRVALWSYNSANWLIAFFAIVHAGGTAVLVNYSMSSADAAGLLTMTETGFLLCGDNGETKKDPGAMANLAALRASRKATAWTSGPPCWIWGTLSAMRRRCLNRPTNPMRMIPHHHLYLRNHLPAQGGADFPAGADFRCRRLQHQHRRRCRPQYMRRRSAVSYSGTAHELCISLPRRDGVSAGQL